MRGRKPLPPALKLVKGTLRAHREPAQREVGLSPELVLAPPWLSPAEVEVFEEVAAELYRLGVATRLDRELVAHYSAAVCRFRACHEVMRRIADKDPGSHGILVGSTSGGLKKNPLLSVLRAESAEVARLGSELGLSPVARIRLGVGTSSGAKGGTAGFFT